MATPKWFDANVYMQNKLAQLKAQEPDANWSWDNLYDAFRDADFVGEEGQYEHFVKFGAAEEVAPNAYFNADEYYAAKAKQYYEEVLKQEFTGSEEQIAHVKSLIKNEGMNAWTHYQQFGSAEGVDPSNAFDASAYCAAKALAMNDAGLKDAAGNDWTADSIKTAIDQAGMSVLEHYLTYAGTGEGEVAAGSTYPVSEDEQVVVPNPGETVVVDGSATTYTGTAGDDTFYLKTDVVLQEYDTLDGGEGNDTLILNAQDQAGTIKNIENLVVRNGNGKTYDLSAFSSSFTLESGNAAEAGNAEVTVNNVAGQKLVVANTATASKLIVNMAADQTSVDLTSQNRDAAQTFALKGDSLSSVKLTVDESKQVANFTGTTATVTDLAITAADSGEDGTATVGVNDLSKLVNITVTGAGKVKLNNVQASVETVNATDNTGGVAVDLSTATKAAFAGGAGADELTIAASTVAHDLGAGDDTLNYTAGLGVGGSVAGGEGTDTISLQNAQLGGLKTDFANGNITGFEALTVTDQLANNIDMKDYAGIDHLTLAGIAGSKIVDNMQSGSTLELTTSASGNFTVNVADAAAGKADVLNIALADDAAVDGKTITVADVETINVVATDTDGDSTDAVITHTLTLTANKATTVTVSGDAKLDLSLTNSLAVNSINASENTGGLNVNLDTAKLSGITVTGSSAADTITLGFNNTVNGMGGDDTFTVTKAAEGKVNTSYSTIQGFAAGDKLAITAATKVVNAETLQGDTLEAAVTSSMTKDAANTAVSFTWGNDTYVVYDADQNGRFDANDFLVKLAGVTGVEFEADGSGNLSLA